MAPERCIIASFLIGFCVVMLGNPHAAPGRDHECIFLSATAQNSAQNQRNNQRKLSTASAGHHIKESWLL
jgi:hypothetical protein